VLQKHAVRSISDCKHNSHSTPLLKELELLKAENLYKISCMKLYYIYDSKTILEYFQDMFFLTHENTPRPAMQRKAPKHFTDTKTSFPHSYSWGVPRQINKIQGELYMTTFMITSLCKYEVCLAFTSKVRGHQTLTRP